MKLIVELDLKGFFLNPIKSIWIYTLHFYTFLDGSSTAYMEEKSRLDHLLPAEEKDPTAIYTPQNRPFGHPGFVV